MATRTLVSAIALFAAVAGSVDAGQAPGAASAPDQPVSSRDRVYLGEQFSNTISVVDPASNTLVGVIRLGDPQPGNMSPLYRGQLLVHGLGFSPDHRTLVAVSIGSNSVSFIDTVTNAVKHITYVGRSPHEAFFTPDGREVWVSVRGEDYVSVLDAKRYALLELLRRTLGEGESDDCTRVNLVSDQVGDSLRDDLGLTRSGRRDDLKMASTMLDGG